VTAGESIETATIIGDGSIPAVVELDDVRIEGPRIELDMTAQRADVPGAGRLTLMSPRDLRGRAADRDAIQARIIAPRNAKSLVSLEPGQTLLIGGLTQESTIKTQDKVPILGDLPILGFFFRNRADSVQRQHVIFAISPRIVQRGDMEIDF